jgi:hypothetical protein
MHTRSALRLLTLNGLALFAVLATHAQIPPSSSTTSTPIPGAGHNYLGVVNETVNRANGSISIRIPVIMSPSLGITLPFSFASDSNGVNYLGLSGSATNGQWGTISSVRRSPEVNFGRFPADL